MANIGSNWNFRKNQALNFVLHLLGAAPGSPTEGQQYHNTVDHHPYYHDGTDFRDLTDALKLGGQNSAYHLDRTNHTGTQGVATISGFDTQVRTNRLDQMAAPTASVAMNSQKLTGLANGTNPQDAATFAQVEAARQGIRSKAPVEVAASTNVTIANPGTDTFNGVTLAVGESILLLSQTTATENGIYIFNGTAVPMTRREDADTFAEIDGGTETFAQGGDNAYAGKLIRQLAEISSFAGQDWQVVGAGTTYSAGDGLAESPAGTFNVGAGTGITVNSNDVAINTGIVPRMYSGTIGDNAATSFTISAATHGLGTGKKKIVQIFEDSTGEQWFVDVTVETDGDVVIAFAVAPTAAQFRVNILGIV